MERIPLSLVPRRLRDDYGLSADYRRCYMGAVNGRFPAERLGREWSVAEADMPAVAAAMSGSQARTSASVSHAAA